MKRRTFLGSALAFFLPAVATAKKVVDAQPSIFTNLVEFCKFFEKFNGFPINELQKMMYIWYENDYGVVTMGRQTGCSTFLVTLGNWEASKGKSVLHISSNEHLRSRVCDLTWNDRNGMGYKGIHFGISHLHGGNDVSGNDIVLYDNSYDDKMYTNYSECDAQKKFMLVTQENKSKLDFPLLPQNI